MDELLMFTKNQYNTNVKLILSDNAGEITEYPWKEKGIINRTTSASAQLKIHWLSVFMEYCIKKLIPFSMLLR